MTQRGANSLKWDNRYAPFAAHWHFPIGQVVQLLTIGVPASVAQRCQRRMTIGIEKVNLLQETGGFQLCFDIHRESYAARTFNTGRRVSRTRAVDDSLIPRRVMSVRMTCVRRQVSHSR